MLLVTWSGLTNGNVEATKLDIDFCRQLTEETDKELSRITGKKVETSGDCNATYARSIVEGTRTFEDFFDASGLAFAKERVARLSEYDRKRRAAYRLEVGLSSQYADSKIIVNALSVAQVVPFIVVIILSIVAVLGFQQNACRSHLRELLREVKSAEERYSGIAGSQFLSGLDVNTTGKLGRWFVISPEGVAICTLVAGVYYLLIAVLLAFIVNLIHLTSSIFFNYLCALFSLFFVLTVATWCTRMLYENHMGRASKPSPKFGSATRWLNNRWWVYALSGMALLSVFMPWTSTAFGSRVSLSGYHFVLNQAPVFQQSGHTQYPVAPKIFFEIRLQLAVVAIFIASCVLRAFLARRPKTRWDKTVRRGNQLLALVALFLSLNYLLYMGALEYGAITGTDFDSTLIPASLNPVGGYSMSWYYPAYGFVIFLLSCFMLVWLALRQESAGKSH